ncbi:hypothetical protein GOP47_0000729 [Adiantum capillus-veneris]|uniref:Uncharacterized protein n=1 Tax=Adiantum capillus-veneris TaxID=13818 RepID=A0A9D4VEH7_ADICA|nr:hypothetical protein GOP47_0000729 [Adiantum capillus-veneris]
MKGVGDEGVPTILPISLVGFCVQASRCVARKDVSSRRENGIKRGLNVHRTDSGKKARIPMQRRVHSET